MPHLVWYELKVLDWEKKGEGEGREKERSNILSMHNYVVFERK